MISKIQGTLEALEHDTALVRLDASPAPNAGSFTYSLMVSPYTAARLANFIGQLISLYTLYYIESPQQGASAFPRLIGFLTPTDRQFFELFTTCKGIGHRKALRAMAIATPQIAAAIANRDPDTLESLPEIGKRTAETVIATLRGKIEQFIEHAPLAADPAKAGPAASASSSDDLTRQALDVLVQLGENRAQAMAWIDRALSRSEPRPKDFQQLLTAVYRVKSGG